MNLNKRGRWDGRPQNHTNQNGGRNYHPNIAVNQAITEPWTSIFQRCGLPEPRRGRAKCPFHDGDSNQSLSVDDNRGLFHCFVCHVAGDKIDFIRRLHGYSFREALTFFSLTPGALPKPDSEAVRARKIETGLNLWVARERHRIGQLLYSLNKILTVAESRLITEPDDSRALFSLSIVYKLYAPLEHLHDLLLSRNADDRLRIFKEAA